MGCNPRNKALQKLSPKQIKQQEQKIDRQQVIDHQELIQQLQNNPESSIILPPPSFYTEAQLHNLLLTSLRNLYTQSLSHLVEHLGFSEDKSLDLLLRRGLPFSSSISISSPPLQIILHNVLENNDNDSSSNNDQGDAGKFSDLRNLEEYSIAGMLCLLRQLRPSISRLEALWCLLMSDLHIGRASSIEIPYIGGNQKAAADSAPVQLYGDNQIGDHNAVEEVTKSLEFMRVMERGGGGNTEDEKIASSVGCNGVSSLLAEEVVKSSEGDSVKDGEEDEQDEMATAKNGRDVVVEVMKSLGEMNLEGNEKKKEMVMELVNEIRELERQLEERKKWAREKAVQAAKKLSGDLAELKTLRMEKQENQKEKKGKATVEDATMKRLAEMEAALRKASGEVDRANAEVRRLETENAEIRAEMEASKLSAAESVAACLEAAKREKRVQKRLLAWEKQQEKMEAETAEERNKIVQTQQQLDEVKEAQRQAELNWKQELKAKELAISKVEEERTAKEAVEASVKRKHEALRQKIELDFQRHKDDIQRLEDELSRLRASAQLSTQTSTEDLSSEYTEATKMQKKTIPKMPQGLNKSQEVSRKGNRTRECVLCMKDEVSVVFLPCAHQVLCASCNEQHVKMVKSSCPCCNTRISQRIRVYGVSS